MSNTEQLPLTLWPQQLHVLETFVDGPNAAVRSALQSQAEASAKHEPILYLAGATASGKTHLADALCRLARWRGVKSSRLDLTALADFGPGVLQGLETQSWVVLDGLDAVIGNAAWEKALFDLLNRVREQDDCQLLLIAAAVQRELPVELPDLRTRLAWGPNYQLQALTADADLRALLTKRANQCGLEFSSKTLDKIFKKHSRNARDLAQLFQRIQQRTASRKIDIGQQLIDQLLADSADEA